ncbi:MAG: hypothetical protein KR126chlam5_00193 [Candidatus Anoxychlamydiales bacterium]|nr:hypothetical protein [Candidatus Anoxychlamydiales bacterium]
MKNSYSVESIANSFLRSSFAGDNSITPMKIQKLIYLAHGYSLVMRDISLIDELFEAWRFGPVLPSIYHTCKKYGNKSISDYLKEPGYDLLSTQKTTLHINDPQVVEIINFVWENYGLMNALELSDWTHEKGGPWDIVIGQKGERFKNQTIDNELIKKYFEERMIDNGL